ncbi:MAG: hypothetical protein AUF76_07255 [Acidobacteria bacterium 13_1_20CM_2_65_9]|nr:MAG: hypothetical protein AUF76_07255 [Acidobacteria bacterium 13_1_20CM_2_65_9]
MKIPLATLALALVAPALHAAPLTCNLTDYKAAPGLTAKTGEDALAVTWDGENGAELRMRLAIDGGTPTIRELAIRRKGGPWSTLATNVTPEFRVVSGLRRVTSQQLRPDSLAALGVKITPEILDAYQHEETRGDEWIKLALRDGGLTAETIERIKWEAFWDAPLYLEGSSERPPTHATSIPPMGGIFNQPGLPRRPEEITRATATYRAQGCEVKTNGARLEISFPGLEVGVFSGRLQYDVFKGSNLIRQVAVAKTDRPSVAFKYDGGLKGLPIQPTSRVTWRDLSNRWQDQQFGGLVSQSPAIVFSSNRVIAAELQGGSIAVFPPPHSYYWARESSQNLGASWYRKDSDTSFSFGLRQAENEEDPEFFHNFALYSARPGTWQQMPVFLYISPESGQAAIDSALTFTHGDRFKPLSGYKVMGNHYHVGLVERLRKSGGMDNRLNDVEAAKGAGIEIYGIIDGVSGRGGPEQTLKGLADYYDAARRHSDKNFLVMPDRENPGVELRAHTDLMLSKPVFWLPRRAAGQPLVEQHPKYGTVYNLGSPADMMAMTERENALIFMPHPRSKASTGFPDAIKDTPHFRHENYRGLGYRWGMGIDASEKRLCEYRCLGLWDEVNNWMADVPTPPKYNLAISEARSDIGDRGRPTWDDTYGMSPVNYVKLDRLPTVDDMSPIINALKRGDFFVTSGEVLISSYGVEGTGDERSITADVEWTFPLDFVEVVWGDGQKTDRQIIPTTDLPAFGKKRFQIPFKAAGKKWVRFAAWDVATNGAFVQPIKLTNAASPTTAR